MALTVKAYLLREPEGNEIRRFSVDQDVCSSHTYLREKIAHLFPVLQNERFSLYWKDKGEELIAFSSDEEQTEALGFVNDGVFKVYIKEISINPGPEEENGVFHPNVFCNGCEGRVYGVRYKCTVCQDYDLCSRCKAKGLHSEHNMTAISHPCCGRGPGYGCCGGPPPRHGPFHRGPHHHGHHHGGPHHGPPIPGVCPFGSC